MLNMVDPVPLFIAARQRCPKLRLRPMDPASKTCNAVPRPYRLFRQFFALLLLLLFGNAAQAQVDNVYVYGTVKDYNTNKKLDGVTVTVFKDGTKFASVVTSANGKYEYNLDYGYEYKLLFEKPGMVGKNVTINTRSIPEEQRVGGLAMNVEMTLFTDIPGINYSILQQPIGKSKYDPSTQMLAWDLEYTEQMRAELDRLQKEYDEKKKREANADEAFNKLMDQGNAAMGTKDYKKAVQSFTDALGLKPADPIAKAKLSDAQMRVNEQNAAEAKEKQYADLIKAADGLFGKKSYDEAKAKYTEAAAIKDQETYPKQKIKECDAFLADLAKKAEADKKAKELNDKYNAAVAAGDAAFKGAKYDEAKAKYTEAAGLKPEEKYPPQQLAAIAAKLDELAKKAEADKQAAALEASYNAAIKAGDDAFKAAKYDDAKAKYNEALGIKPKEKYPNDQLAAIEKKLAELAAKADADKKAAELDAKYQAAIKDGDDAFKAGTYDVAKTKYNEALGLKPKEKYPTDQLAAIEKKLAELAAKAEADKQAAALDAKYQGILSEAEALFTGAKYPEAKSKFQEALKVKPNEAHPKERIVEIDAKIADLAKQAELAKKQAELDAKYNRLIASADKNFDAKKNSDALNDYKDASALKPDEQYPKDRIAAINAMLDAKAKEQAEKERLAREQQEKDQQYAALIDQADKDFKAKSYEAAAKGYTSALEVKPGEKHPTDRLAEINALLADRAAADSARAAKEAADRAAAADIEARYNSAIAKADQAFASQSYDAAKESYTEALSVKPGEKYPKDQIKAIEKAIADQSAASKAAADAAEKQRLADEERRKREQAAADSAQAAMNSAMQERDRLKALDEQYAQTLLQADQAMAGKDYQNARGLYAQALDIKPKESYPQVKIDQIDKLLAEADRRAREAEANKQQAADAAPPPPETSTTDNRKEQEAEVFMREAREREEAEKYERIKRLMASVEQQRQENASKAEERHAGAARQNKDYTEGSEGLYQGSEDWRKRNAKELEALREAWAKRQQELMGNGVRESEKAMAATEATQAQIQQEHIARRDAHEEKVKAASEAQQDWARQLGGYAQGAKERSDTGVSRAQQEAQGLDALAKRGNAQSERERDLVERQKAMMEAREQQFKAGAANRVAGEQARIDNITPNQPRSFSDYNRNKLASQYPQGVTEESYTEGNKVIIRRVVVQGNKADEYSKVIAKWGTFYFKNGQSISEQIWSVNTEK
jgi:hypothetical protein